MLRSKWGSLFSWALEGGFWKEHVSRGLQPWGSTGRYNPTQRFYLMDIEHIYGKPCSDQAVSVCTGLSVAFSCLAPSVTRSPNSQDTVPVLCPMCHESGKGRRFILYYLGQAFDTALFALFTSREGSLKNFNWIKTTKAGQEWYGLVLSLVLYKIQPQI